MCVYVSLYHLTLTENGASRIYEMCSQMVLFPILLLFDLDLLHCVIFKKINKKHKGGFLLICNRYCTNPAHAISKKIKTLMHNKHALL